MNTKVGPIVLVLGILIILTVSSIFVGRYWTAIAPKEDKWERSNVACNINQDCIDYLKYAGISPIYVDWVRCNAGMCEFYNEDPSKYTGEVIE